MAATAQRRFPSPTVRHRAPTASLVEWAIGCAWLGVAGWRVEGELPPCSKAILVASPHTSGWDLPFMLAAVWSLRLRVSWLGKHTLFEGAKGMLMTRLGGIPVDRREPHGLVAQIVARIEASDGLYLAIAPAGTRSQSDRWKSGFYRIAEGAKIPLLCGFLDYRRKVAGVGLSFVPTGDVARDMDRIRAFYRGMEGKNPHRSVAMRLREEAVFPAAAPDGAAVVSSAPDRGRTRLDAAILGGKFRGPGSPRWSRALAPERPS